MINVTIFNEFIHERENETVRRIYPDGIHQVLAAGLSQHDDLAVRTATLEEPEHGLTEAVLAQTDVLLWWGHGAHARVADTIVDRIQARVLTGMGLIVLHSGHHSKVFKRLMGTSCGLTWREAGEKERLWVVNPAHPIAHGLNRFIEIPSAEMYGEFFDIPDPDELIFISWFEGGDVFRSGATWRRGQGRIFYFRPGHETYPIYYQPEVQQVILNGVRWAAFRGNNTVTGINNAPNVKVPLEPIGR
ncbi:MAG: ThuA domain-containing protein [Anaerolineae bacterium]|nr:ThuA domain-containing protein [Anaerolineae bacterium]MCO5187417.1 ThuA domain-containing protein [Anaerolineae bacterium]MCO5194140.1 ThuA domain-containing protein [Anaerolineae bacterium]MCO5198860.1 ThuA domain-containing protein [Anaerolineae bacterium]MCO5205393.1 ThuA domain-containing protein [Anaerolineae bacterium]